MRGRKPKSPKVRGLADGTLRVLEGGRKPDAPPAPPEWLKDENGRALWSRQQAELVKLRRWSPLFAEALGRYCVAFGQYVWALRKLADPEESVQTTPNGMLQLSAYQVILNRAHTVMRELEADLGLNPVGYHRLDGLQPDLFGQPASGAGNPFAQFRR